LGLYNTFIACLPILDMQNVGDVPWDDLLTKETRGLGN